MTTDGDSFTAIDRADDLSVAGDDAHAGPVEHAPHAPGGGVVGDGLVSQLHVRGHAPWHRYAQDAALHKPRPFTRVVDRMLEGHFVFAVQGLSDRAGNGDKCAQAVVAEVCAVGRIDADRGVSPPRGHNKKHRTLIRCLIGSSRETGMGGLSLLNSKSELLFPLEMVTYRSLRVNSEFSQRFIIVIESFKADILPAIDNVSNEIDIPCYKLISAEFPDFVFQAKWILNYILRCKCRDLYEAIRQIAFHRKQFVFVNLNHFFHSVLIWNKHKILLSFLVFYHRFVSEPSIQLNLHFNITMISRQKHTLYSFVVD